MSECTEIIPGAIEMIVSSILLEAPDNSYISVTVCDRLNNPVFAESSTYYKPSNNYSKVKHPDNNECKLFVVPSILHNESGNIEKFSKYLWDRYQNEFSGSRFSFINGQFIKFSENDNNLILGSYSLEEDEDA